MVEGSDLPVIEASEILERIEHGEPVIYEHVAIAGDIDLSRLDLPFIHNERSGDMSTLAHVLPLASRSGTQIFWGGSISSILYSASLLTSAARPFARRRALNGRHSMAVPDSRGPASLDMRLSEMQHS